MKKTILLLVFFLLIGVGCSSRRDSDEITNEETSEETATPEVTEKATVVATEEAVAETEEPVVAEKPAGPAPAGTLRYGVNTVLKTLNPWNEQAPAYFGAYHIVYEGLLIEDVNGQVQPLLATDWEYDEALTTLTLTLREGVTFHDGAPFNAEVAAANLNYIKDSLEFPPTKNQLNAVESILVVDQTTLVLSLSRPDIALVQNLARNAGIMISPNAFDSADSNPIGTGPWQFVADESTLDGTVVFELNETYWDPSVQGVERIEYTQIPDNNARLNALLAGDLDISTLQSNQVTSAEAEGFDITTAPTVGFGLQVADLNGEVIPQLADKEFRCGISQAIDRETIADVLFKGLAVPGVQRELRGQYGYLETPPEVGFNPEEATAKLEGNEDVVITTGAWGPFNPIAQAFAGAMTEYGDITVEIEAIQSNQMWPILAQATHPIAVVPYPESHLITAIRNRAVNGPFNPSGVIPDQVEALLAEAETLSEADAEEVLEEIKSIMIDECIWINVLVLEGAIAHNPDVSGVIHRMNVPASAFMHGVRVDGY